MVEERATPKQGVEVVVILLGLDAHVAADVAEQLREGEATLSELSRGPVEPPLAACAADGDSLGRERVLELLIEVGLGGCGTEMCSSPGGR